MDDSITGWTISHAPAGGTIRRTGTSITKLAYLVRREAAAYDWRTLAPLFTASASFGVEPEQAQKMAAALTRTAHSPLVAPWSDLLNALARAANCAAEGGETWRWSHEVVPFP